MKPLTLAIFVVALASHTLHPAQAHELPSADLEEGSGQAHMQTS